MEDRPYQEIAITRTERAWSEGARSVCLVAPPGSGKTYMGSRLVGERRSLWITHRVELVEQAATELRLLHGASNVGYVFAPGSTPRIRVASIQELLANEWPRDVDLAVLDETHHYVAEQWISAPKEYLQKPLLGLTATPERYDGRPLGDIFEHLVVAAQYSELIEAGHLVSARVFQPEENLGSDLCMDPLEAWALCSEGAQGFAFLARVASSEKFALRARKKGVRAEHLEHETPALERSDMMSRFGQGRIDLLSNVFILTEGVNVPEARVALLARGFSYPGALRQATGRVLRAAPGKPDGIVIDLCGSTLAHGMPDADCDYSLEGRAITPRESEEPDEPGAPRGFLQKLVDSKLVLAQRGALAADAKLPDGITLREVRTSERSRDLVKRGRSQARREFLRKHLTGIEDSDG